MLAVDERIQKALQLFFPSVEPMEGIVTLLLEKARRTYLKYKIINELLQSKYNMQFDEFSKSKFMEEPSFEVEQDFFDWDMAITGMGDMVSEIKHFRVYALMKNTVSLIYQQLLKCRQDASFSHVDILEHTLNIIKARLYNVIDYCLWIDNRQ